ncbi:penicillin-binding protein 1B [Motiliproteus sp. SC1-56]|uniref:penicillin-binding protein 1B n=1 Tax=Motiliproteus sp. SC1-56 TaxID=2799565 RepID=UPI001A8E0C08|nr:penicillin-binding protein 1B [Motiliproteus sp. SC1-56]
MAKKSPPARRSKPRKKAPSSRPLRWWPLLLKLGLVVSVALIAGLVYLDATIRSQFEGKRWALPAKVYARPLEIYQDRPLNARDLRLELDQLGYRFVSYPRRPGEASINGDRVVLQTRGFRFPDGEEPSRRLELRFAGSTVSSLREESGAPLALVRLEPVVIGGIYPADNEDRELVQLEEVPPALVQALIAVEDRDFYRHPGISLKGIARAVWSNLRAGQVVQGGSTLTQQLVKNYFLTSERSLIRKLIEAPMALLLELHYDKDEILEAYLNEVYLGQAGARAIHGFGLASQYYFGRPLRDLRLDQLSLLAGLVKGPSYLDPRRHPERALARRNLVISLLEQQGVVDAGAASWARRRPLDVVEKTRVAKGNFPAYLDLVKRRLREEYRQEDLASEGLQIFTSMDPVVQRKAEQSLVGVIERLERSHGKSVAELEGALVVGNSQSGEVVAVVGGRDPRFKGFNRALDAVRPIGSLVKPAVYLAALEQPKRYTLATPLDDDPVEVANPDGSLWQPQNFDHQSHGAVPLHRALALSYNQATARLGMTLGMDRVIDVLQRLGVDKEIPPYPATLLGALSLSPMEVMQLYQTLAANGFETPLRVIRSVLTAEGELLSSYHFELEQQFDPASMHLLHYALQETVREGTARALYGRFPDSLNMAGKTGTTNDQRDSWFAGFTGDYLAVAWLGEDDNRPTPLTGSSGALKVWAELMASLGPRSYRAVIPEGVSYHWVDEARGALTAERCPNARLMPFIEGTAPEAYVGCGGLTELRKPLNWFNRIFGD